MNDVAIVHEDCEKPRRTARAWGDILCPAVEYNKLKRVSYRI